MKRICSCSLAFEQFWEFSLVFLCLTFVVLENINGRESGHHALNEIPAHLEVRSYFKILFSSLFRQFWLCLAIVWRSGTFAVLATFVFLFQFYVEIGSNFSPAKGETVNLTIHSNSDI